MGRAREEMHDHEQYLETRDLLIVMLRLLREFPTASVEELKSKADLEMLETEEYNELARKMEKDD